MTSTGSVSIICRICSFWRASSTLRRPAGPSFSAAADSAAGRQCDWLLVSGTTRGELAAPDGGWSMAWEGNRPAERKEKFRLYRR